MNRVEFSIRDFAKNRRSTRFLLQRSAITRGALLIIGAWQKYVTKHPMKPKLLRSDSHCSSRTPVGWVCAVSLLSLVPLIVNLTAGADELGKPVPPAAADDTTAPAMQTEPGAIAQPDKVAVAPLKSRIPEESAPQAPSPMDSVKDPKPGKPELKPAEERDSSKPEPSAPKLSSPKTDSKALLEPVEPPKRKPTGNNRAKYSIRRNIVYKVAGHRSLRADAYMPKGDGPFPAVLLLHGGGWKAGSRKQMIYHAKRLAPNGYVAFAIDYRLAPQYKFPIQIEDCRDAVRYLRERSDELNVDPNRIAAYGYSAGGHLACLLGTSNGAAEVGLDELIAKPAPASKQSAGKAPIGKRSGQQNGEVSPPADESDEHDSKEASVALKTCSRVQAVIAGGAPCDFEIIPPDEKFLSYWLIGTRAAYPALYRSASPLAAATSDDAPALFYHGEKDTLVPTFSAQRMRDRLDELGVRTQFYICPKKGHYRAFLDAGAFQHALAFLDHELKPSPEATATPAP